MVKIYLKRLSKIFVKYGIGYYSFFILSILLQFIYYKIKSEGYSMIGSGGDFVSIVNIKEVVRSWFYTYDPTRYGGTDWFAFTLALYPYYIVMFILSTVGIKGALLTWSFMCCLWLVSLTGVYNLINSLTKSEYNFENRTIALIGAFIYTYSPYFLLFFPPGHFLIIIQLSLSPWILLFLFKCLKEKKLSLSQIVITATLMTFASPAFSNVGNLIIISTILFLFVLLFGIINKNILKSLHRFIYIYLIFIVINLWWIMPSVISLHDIITRNNLSVSTIGASVDYATRFSSLTNIIIGAPEGPNLSLVKSSTFINWIFPITYVAFWIFAIISLFKRNKTSLGMIMMLLILLIIFLVKGEHSPFGQIFNFLYNNIFGFQILRRPASKLYPLLLLLVISIGSAGLAKILNNKNKCIKRVSLLILLIISAISTIIFTYSSNKSLILFNIPIDYVNSNNFLINDNVEKVIVFPDLGETSPYPKYNNEVSNVSGVDFINELWKFPKLIPNRLMIFGENSEISKVNSVVSDIESGINICSKSIELGISHVILRKNLDRNYYDIKKIEDMVIKLTINDAIENVIKVGEDIVIGKIKSECRENIITSDSSEITIAKINQTKYLIKIHNHDKKIRITFKEPTNTDIQLFLSQKPSTDLQNYNNSVSLLEDIKYLFQPQIPKTSSSNEGYGNEWIIDYSTLSENSKLMKRNDKELVLVLYYKPQLYLYLGICISLCSFVWMIFLILNRKNKFSIH